MFLCLVDNVYDFVNNFFFGRLAKKTVPWLRMPVDSFGQNHLLHSIELQYYKKKMRYMFSLAASHQIDVMVYWFSL